MEQKLCWEYEDNGVRNKTLWLEQYLNNIKPYLKDIINDLKKSLILIKFNLHSKRDNIEIMMIDKADDVIEELFQSLLCRYQIGLETSMKGSEFVFDCV